MRYCNVCALLKVMDKAIENCLKFIFFLENNCDRVVRDPYFIKVMWRLMKIQRTS